MRTMRILLATAFVLAATSAVAAPPPDPSTAGWERGQAYDKQYNPNLEVVVPAVVLKVENFTPAEGMAEGVRAQVQARGETFWVHLAPAAWLAAQQYALAEGAQVVITGSNVRIEGERVILASRVEREGKTFRLRDDSGKPAWANWRPRPA